MVKKSKKSTATKPRAMQVDFTGVEGKRGGRRIPEGDYLMEIVDWAVDHKKDDESSQFVKIFYKIQKGPTDGKWEEIFGLKQNQLWRLRNFLEALGFDIPSSRVKVPFEKLVGKKIAMTIADDTYENKTKSQVQDWFPSKDYEALATDEEEEDEDEDEDEDAATEAATSDDEDEDEESEDEDEDEDELELVDEDNI